MHLLSTLFPLKSSMKTYQTIKIQSGTFRKKYFFYFTECNHESKQALHEPPHPLLSLFLCRVHTGQPTHPLWLRASSLWQRGSQVVCGGRGRQSLRCHRNPKVSALSTPVSDPDFFFRHSPSDYKCCSPASGTLLHTDSVMVQSEPPRPTPPPTHPIQQ